jgi:hypothetical protein
MFSTPLNYKRILMNLILSFIAPILIILSYVIKQKFCFTIEKKKLKYLGSNKIDFEIIIR